MRRKLTILLAAVGLVFSISAESTAAVAPKRAVAHPVIASIKPNFGPTTGGLSVLIQGRGFAIGLGRTHVVFGSVSVQAVCETTALCTARTPPHPRANVRVKVVTRAGRSARSSLARFGFIATTPSALITTSLELDEATVPAGTTISASFVIDTPGEAVLVSGCSEDSAITLSNGQVTTGGVNAAVGCSHIIESGTTRQSVSVPTAYQQCSQNAASATTKSPPCPPPPLPAGTYEVTYEPGFQVVGPAPVAVSLTS